MNSFPPGLILVLGAPLLLVRSRVLRTVIAVLLPAIALTLVWRAPGALVIDFLDYQLFPLFERDYTKIFATVFSIMALVGGLYAAPQARRLEMVAAFVYAGSAICVTYAGDLVTLFIFWEIMAIGSTLVIWSAGTPEAYRASMRYLLVHLMGGVILMAGIAGYVAETGGTGFGIMTAESLTWPKWLILIGFLINAGAPPLSAWLPDAYPEASPSGAVFLSAFTTKTAVFVLLSGFPGQSLLIGVGLYMIFYGIIYALLENDMRRILAYSIINQVGFMVTGIGIGGDLALSGAATHAFAHIIYKALLLMSAGSVLYMTGKRKCTDLGGLFQSMPVTTICGTIGALAISSFPFTSGFVTKSMIASAAQHEHLAFVWFCLTAASAGVFLHAGIKFPWFVFFQKDSGLRPPDPPLNMRIAMYAFAFLCIFLGLFFRPLYNMLPVDPHYPPYTAAHLVEQFQLLLFAGLAFFVMLPMMKRTLTISLDFDWFYRRLFPDIGRSLVGMASSAYSAINNLVQQRGPRAIDSLYRVLGPYSKLTRRQSTGSMTFWVTLLLALVLLFYYL